MRSFAALVPLAFSGTFHSVKAGLCGHTRPTLGSVSTSPATTTSISTGNPTSAASTTTTEDSLSTLATLSVVSPSSSIDSSTLEVLSSITVSSLSTSSTPSTVSSTSTRSTTAESSSVSSFVPTDSGSSYSTTSSSSEILPETFSSSTSATVSVTTSISSEISSSPTTETVSTTSAVYESSSSSLISSSSSIVTSSSSDVLPETSSSSLSATTSIATSSSSGVSSSSTTTGPLQAVTNEVQNGNFAFADSRSSDGLYAFEAINQARQVPDKGYTGDGSQETGCAQLEVQASSSNDLSERQATAPDDSVSGIQQWLELPAGRSPLTLHLYYAVVTSDTSSACSLQIYFGGSFMIASPFFNVVANGNNPTWFPLAYQAAQASTKGYLRMELVCLGGRGASIRIDQIFATTAVTLAELSQVRMVWPNIDGQTQSRTSAWVTSSQLQTSFSTNAVTSTQAGSISLSATGSTQTQSTAGHDTTETLTSSGTSVSISQSESTGTRETHSQSDSTTKTGSSIVSSSSSTFFSSDSTSSLQSNSTTSISSATASETQTSSTTSQISSLSATLTISTAALSFSETSNGSTSGHASNTTASITSESSTETSFSTPSITEMTFSSIPTGQSTIESITASNSSSFITASSFESVTTVNSTSSVANSTATMTSGFNSTSALNATSTSSETLWTISVTGTMTPTSSASATATDGDHPEPTSLEDLSPAAREIYDFIVDHLDVDENGTVNIPAPPQGETELIPSSYDPDDLARQKELEDELEAMGMPPLDDLFSSANEKVDAVESGTCPNLDKRSFKPILQRTRAPKRRHESRFLEAAQNLEHRLSKRDFWDVGCHDATEAVLGVSETLENAQKLMCLGKDIYDSRDAFKCLFGGCGPMVLYEELNYSWNYEWKVFFPSITRTLLQTADGSYKLTCVDCSFNVSSLKFSGKIVVRKASGKIEIREATLIPEVTGAANMIVELKTGAAWSSDWKQTFEAATLSTIRSDKAYSIESKILYNLGVKWTTDKAISVKGGASFSFNNARAELNMASNTPNIKSSSGWNPSVSYITPSFQTTGGLTLQPYIRWGVEFNVNIFDQVKITPALVSESLVTIKSTFSSQAQGSCPANKLAVSTFVTTKNNMRLPGSGMVGLYNGDSQSANNCFDAPDLVPSVDEIRSLASVGGEFCTSYVGYTPSKTIKLNTAIAYTPSTTITEMRTTTIPITTIKTVFTTASMKQLVTVESLPTGVTVTAGTAGLTLKNLKRDATPTAAPAAGVLAARWVPTPAMVSNWDSAKISFACKQVATGLSTITQTVTSTSPSGAVTTTSTVTENIDGPLIVRTRADDWVEYDGITETPAASPEWATEPTVTACAVPEPSSGTCFKIKVHGPSWVDGQYMKHWENGGFVAGNAMEVLYFGTYYLTSSGHLVSQDPRATASLVIIAGHPFSSNNGLWTNPNGVWATEDWRDMSSHEPLLCSKDPDPCSRALHCYTESRDGLSFIPPAYYNADAIQSYIHFRVHVGSVSGAVPATFTWEPTPCICGGDFRWVQRPDWEYYWEEGMDEGYWRKRE